MGTEGQRGSGLPREAIWVTQDRHSLAISNFWSWAVGSSCHLSQAVLFYFILFSNLIYREIETGRQTQQVLINGFMSPNLTCKWLRAGG